MDKETKILWAIWIVLAILFVIDIILKVLVALYII